MNNSPRASLCVLYVDDDAESLARIKTRLEAVPDVSVRTTTDPDTALDVLRDETVDCVVSDCGHRLRDGDSFLPSVRRVSANVPLVLFTDAEAEAAARVALAVHADEVHRKDAGESGVAYLVERVRTLDGGPPVGRSEPRTATDTAVVAHDRLIATAVDALDALDDVFYVFDTQGRLVQWNRRLNELFGLTDRELAGMGPADFFVPADRPAIRRAVTQTFERGEVVVEAHAETIQGTILFELTGRLLTDDDGTAIGLCGVGRDVTAPRRQALQLERQNRRLEEFANVVAHDLRNPLGVARGFLDLERERGNSQNLDRVAVSLDRMDHLIEEVLTAAREGQSVDVTTPTDVEAVARAAWETVDTGAATLVVEPTGAVEADEPRLQRLFENLYRNAVEHGGDAVAVRVGPLDGRSGFYVEDDGPGIPDENRHRVFTPRFTTSDDGTGFGLDIVRTLTEAHGWRVMVGVSEAGGARFEFVGAELDDTEGGTVDADVVSRCGREKATKG